MAARLADGIQADDLPRQMKVSDLIALAGLRHRLLEAAGAHHVEAGEGRPLAHQCLTALERLRQPDDVIEGLQGIELEPQRQAAGMQGAALAAGHGGAWPLGGPGFHECTPYLGLTLGHTGRLRFWPAAFRLSRRAVPQHDKMLLPLICIKSFMERKQRYQAVNTVYTICSASPIIMTAKIRLSSATGRRCASLAPTGAISMLKGAINSSAGR